jgi:hypothetical protein
LSPVAALRTIPGSTSQAPLQAADRAAAQELSPQDSPVPAPEVSAPSGPGITAVADAQPLNFSEMAAAQRSCPDIVAMRTSPSIVVIHRLVGDVSLLGDISTGSFRPFVPAQFRAAAVRSIHNLHHPGVRATTKLVKASFCWPLMGRFIAALARSCLDCQRAKVHRHVHLQPEVIPVPHRRFSHLHVDLVGPLPRSEGFSYLFTVIDRTTRWPEAIPLAAVTAADCAAALLRGWI